MRIEKEQNGQKEVSSAAMTALERSRRPGLYLPREKDKRNDRQILHDQNAANDAGDWRTGQLQRVERLQGDDRAGKGNQGSEPERVVALPAQDQPEEQAEKHRQEKLQRRSQEHALRRRAQGGQRKLDAQNKEQEADAHLRKVLRVDQVRDCNAARIGAERDTGEHKTEDNRLAEAMGQRSTHHRGDEDDQQGGNKADLHLYVLKRSALDRGRRRFRRGFHLLRVFVRLAQIQ